MHSIAGKGTSIGSHLRPNVSRRSNPAIQFADPSRDPSPDTSLWRVSSSKLLTVNVLPCFTRRFARTFLLPPVLLLVPVLARAQSLAVLPDAPQPVGLETSSPAQAAQQPSNPDPLAQPAKSDPQAASPIVHAPYEERKWAQFVDPGERIPALYARDKWVFWLHEEFRPSSPLPALVSAEYGLLTDDDPKYGTNAEAFGQRLGAALVRQASMRFFSSSMFPVIYGEDPRYYRRAAGNYGVRSLWAFERVFVTQRDSGSHSVNGSLILGHLAASALTLAYYPHDSRNSGVVLRTWGTSIAGAMGNNLFLEFWPDFTNYWRHRQQKEHRASATKR